jgi:hypothetical protein
LKGQKSEIRQFIRDEKKRELKKVRDKQKDIYCMGLKTKLAKGPNPLSVKSKNIKKEGRARRFRWGKRSKALFEEKKKL